MGPPQATALGCWEGVIAGTVVAAAPIEGVRGPVAVSTQEPLTSQVVAF